MSKVKRALVSVSDKTGLVEFAKGLSDISEGTFDKFFRVKHVFLLQTVVQRILKPFAFLALPFARHSQQNQ